MVQVVVRDNNVDQALKALKKKMQREGLFRESPRKGRRRSPRPQVGTQTFGTRRILTNPLTIKAPDRSERGFVLPVTEKAS